MYQKPELNMIADAVEAIQSLTNKATLGQDTNANQAGISAYEADE